MFGITHAPDFDHDGLHWYNTKAPIALADLRGRLVILDFWTFCCVNCLHTLPTLRLVEESFPEEVAVIGVHSPKFLHECGDDALAAALQRYDIRHPVVHDPATILWDQYGVKAWPSLVFISPDGMVIGQMTGEPDPHMLLNGIASMLVQFRHDGQLCPTPLGHPPAGPAPSPGERLRFPGKIKPCPSRDGCKLWAIADTGHHQVVLCDDAGAELGRWGGPEPGFADGLAAARFNGPEGLVCDLAAIYVADTRNHAIRRIDRTSGQVSTLAGTGHRGQTLPDQRSPPSTALASPWDLELSRDSLYFANAGSHQIGRLDLAEDSLHLVAGGGGENRVDGDGAEAQLAQPSGLALGPDGDCLYFTDSESSSIRRLALGDARTVSTISGGGLFDYGSNDGPCARAGFQHPLGLTLGGPGLAVADSYNSSVRLIDLERAEVTSFHPQCADSPCLPWNEPAGIAADGPHRLLLSDTNNHRIVEIRLDRGTARTWMK